jgi:hypothetical protein
MFKLYILLSSVLMGLVTSVYASDAVIIRSNVDNLSSGQLLSKQAVINLSEHSEITAAFATGGVQTLKGPYEGGLSDPLEGQQADSTLLTDLAQFIQKTKAEQGIRERGRYPDSAKLWTVDVNSIRRHYCVPADQPLMLSRPEEESKLASTVLIKHKETEQRAETTWPARKETLVWPDILSPPAYGDTYTVTVKSVRGQEHFKMVVLYRLPDGLPTESHKVVWMAGRGCIPQAEMLLADLR